MGARRYTKKAPVLPHQKRAMLVQTKALYDKADAAFAPFSCPATAECCQLAKTQRPPWLWPSEWQVLVAALVRQGRPLPPPREDGACPLLDETGQRCTVYEDRPLGCRTFFCHRIRGPSRQPVEVMNALLVRLERLNVELDEHASPQPLPQYFEGNHD